MKLNIADIAAFGDQSNNSVELLAPLLFPSSGARMYSLVGPAKTVAQIFLAPGGGVSKGTRQIALGHDVVAVVVRGESYCGQPAPSIRQFHRSTLRWSLGQSHQVAIWSAPYPEFMDDIGRWMCGSALAGSSFHTVIETVPSRAAEWSATVARWKGAATEIRFFGPERVQ